MAGFNIAEFSAKINEHGTLQTNKFIVSITKPAFLEGNDFNRILQFRTSGIKIPGVNFDLLSTYRYGAGPQQKFPTNVNFSDMIISFIETDHNYVWRFFAGWINDIFDFSDRAEVVAKYTAEYKQYITSPTIRIEIYNNNGVKINTVVLKEAYPISLNDIGLSWSDKNTLMMVNVGFTFREWYFEEFNSFSEFESSSAPPTGVFASSRVTPMAAPESPRRDPELRFRQPTPIGSAESFTAITGGIGSNR